MRAHILGLILVLIIVLSGCREPVGGGFGYQYLGHLDEVRFVCDAEGMYTTSFRVDNDTFVVRGRVTFRFWNCVNVWVNRDKKTMRLRRQHITAEHVILTWETPDG